MRDPGERGRSHDCAGRLDVDGMDLGPGRARIDERGAVDETLRARHELGEPLGRSPDVAFGDLAPDRAEETGRGPLTLESDHPGPGRPELLGHVRADESGSSSEKDGPRKWVANGYLPRSASPEAFRIGIMFPCIW